MKFPNKIFWFLFALIVVAILSFYIFVKLNGKSIIEKRLSYVFQRSVTVEDVGVFFPMGIRVRQLEVPGALKVKSMDVQLEVLAFLAGQFGVAEVRLIEPEFLIQRLKGGNIVWGSAAKEEKKEEVKEKSLPRSLPKKGKTTKSAAYNPVNLKLLIEYLEVKDGKVFLLNEGDSKKSWFSIEQILLKARPVSYPAGSFKTKFDFGAIILSKDIPLPESRLNGRGWANFKKRNMRASLEVADPGRKVSISADIVSRNNNMRVDGEMKIGSLTRRKVKADRAPVSFEDFVADAIKSMDINLDVYFSFNTKMDDFHVGPVVFRGEAGYGEGYLNPAEALKEDLKKIGAQVGVFGKKFQQEEETDYEEPPVEENVEGSKEILVE